MAWDTPKDVAATATFTPDSVWSSPSAEVLKPDGSQAETPTPSVSSVSTTIASATDARTFALTSASGVVVGGHYLVTADGWTAVCEVATVDGTDIALASALPDVPAAADTFEGVDITVPIAAASLDEYGVNWRVRVYEDANELVQLFNVVRHVFADPATESDVRELVNEVWRNRELPPEAYRNVAAQATRAVRNELLGLARYPHLFGDSDALKPAGRLAARLELAEGWGLIGPGWDDPERYLAHYESKFEIAVGKVVHSLGAYDSDDDDELDDEATAITFVECVL